MESTRSGEPFLRSLVGIVVLLLIARAVEPLFFGEGYYRTLSIHPFWIVVILAATQNGLFAGVAAAAAAALMMDWPLRPTGTDITEHYVALAVLPVQWLLAAIAIGSVRHGQMRREAQLADDNARLRAMSEDLAAEIDRMDGEIAALELAAATAPGAAPRAETKEASPVATRAPSGDGSARQGSRAPAGRAGMAALS